MAEPALRRERAVVRPMAAVSIPGPFATTEPSWGLVDTGAESVLAAAWIADFAGIDLAASSDTELIGIGGQVAEVTFVGGRAAIA